MPIGWIQYYSKNFSKKHNAAPPSPPPVPVIYDKSEIAGSKWSNANLIVTGIIYQGYRRLTTYLDEDDVLL